MRTTLGTLLIAAALAAGPAAAQGTPPAGARDAQAQMPAAPGDVPINAAQIQRWFEAYTVLQAQDALQLSEAQYGRFVTRLKALQDIRRRHQQARNQILADIRKLTNPQTGPADEAALTDRLKALHDEEDKAAGDIRAAYGAVDETLDVRQQARFRLFEDRMEQQKLELLMRARQNARAARGRK
jgi:hypothetical protein